MDNRRDAETGQVHCGKCGMERNAFTECSCAAKPPPEDQLDQLKMGTVKNLKQVPTVANMTLRDWFAGQMLPLTAEDHLPHSAAKVAYEYGDAMLAAREMKP